MFSILIPTWRNLPYLKLCIASIKEHSEVDHEIWVHVNEFEEETLSFLDQEGISYTKSEANIGICKALNMLASRATQDYLVYLNDDMYVLPKWDHEIMKVIETKPNHFFYLSSTMIEPKKGGHDCMISPYDFGDLPNSFDLQKLLDSYDKLPFEDWNGASWPPSIVHRDLWNSVNGYSEEFSPGLYSDPDFSMKLWNIRVRDFQGVSKSRVYHFQSKSLGRVKLNDGNKQFKKKWGIPASFFYKEYLKIGTAYSGSLPEVKKGIRYYLARVKALLA